MSRQGSPARLPGAVVGCIVATDIQVDELATVMRELDYRNFEDRTVWTIVGCRTPDSALPDNWR
jgi:hypothetical protein